MIYILVSDQIYIIVFFHNNNLSQGSRTFRKPLAANQFCVEKFISSTENMYIMDLIIKYKDNDTIQPQQQTLHQDLWGVSQNFISLKCLALFPVCSTLNILKQFLPQRKIKASFSDHSGHHGQWSANLVDLFFSTFIYKLTFYGRNIISL